MDDDALLLADILQHKIPSIECLERAAAELRRQHALLKEWEEKAATWMASPEAAQRLAGYRDLAQRAANAEAEVERLRGVLTAIVDFVDGPAEGKRPDVFGLLINSARTALARKEPDHA